MNSELCFEDLASELHYYTLKFLGAADLCSFRSVNSYFRVLADSDSLWRRIVRRYTSSATKNVHNHEINWKDLYKEIMYLGFDAKACGPNISLTENNMVAIKDEDHKYSTVLGRKKLTSKTAKRYYWEVNITNMQISGCLCIGVVNSQDAINHPSESHGMFGHYNHGWGLFSDGERCHNATWYRPPCSPFSNNDRVGVLVEYHSPSSSGAQQTQNITELNASAPTNNTDNNSDIPTRHDDELKAKLQKVDQGNEVQDEDDGYVARVEFFVNGVSQGTAFDDIKGPLYPAFAIKRKSEGIKMDPEATIRFCINEQKRVRTNASLSHNKELLSCTQPSFMHSVQNVGTA